MANFLWITEGGGVRGWGHLVRSRDMIRELAHAINRLTVLSNYWPKQFINKSNPGKLQVQRCRTFAKSYSKIEHKLISRGFQSADIIVIDLLNINRDLLKYINTSKKKLSFLTSSVKRYL